MNRLRPALDPLEARDCPSVVLLVDLDTGAVPAPSLHSALTEFAPDVLLTTPYLAPEFDFRAAGTPITTAGVDTDSHYGHGSFMAAAYATAMTRAGLVPIVLPAIVGPPAHFDSGAIGRAMAWVATQQRWADFHHTDVRYIVSLPAEPGPMSASELSGRSALASAGVPLFEAAGNDSTIEPASILPTSTNTVAMAAAKGDGAREPYSNYGPNTTMAVVGSDRLGTSGAALIGAAWAAAEWTWHPQATAAEIVATVRSAGTLADVPYPVPLATPPAIPAPIAIRATKHPKR